MAIKKEVKKANASGDNGAGSSDSLGGGGGGSALKPNDYKVSKLMLWPSRKLNLGNYNTVDLNAGIEIVFDRPVDVNSQDIKDAQAHMRRLIRDEFKEQYAPYMKKQEAKKSE